jgi:hypothetical protein
MGSQPGSSGLGRGCCDSWRWTVDSTCSHGEGPIAGRACSGAHPVIGAGGERQGGVRGTAERSIAEGRRRWVAGKNAEGLVGADGQWKVNAMFSGAGPSISRPRP